MLTTIPLIFLKDKKGVKLVFRWSSWSKSHVIGRSSDFLHTLMFVKVSRAHYGVIYVTFSAASYKRIKISLNSSFLYIFQ